MSLSKKTKPELITLVKILRDKLELSEQNRVKHNLNKKILENYEWIAYLKYSSNHVVLINSDRNIIDVNKVRPDFRKEDILGENIFSMVSIESKKLMKDAIDKVFEKKIPQRYHTSRIVESGETYYYSSLAIPIIEDDKVVAAIIEASDVTGEIKIHNELKESEEKFRMLAQNATDIVYRYKLYPEFKHEYMSPSAEKITGYSPDEFYNDPDLIFKIIHPDDLEAIQTLRNEKKDEIAASVYANKGRISRWVRKDGVVIWIESTSTTIYNNEGKLVAVEGIARDVTDRKQAEKLLVDSENKYRALVEIFQDPIIVSNNGKIRYINPAALKLFGAEKPEQLIGKTTIDLFHPDYHEHIMKVVQNIRSTNSSASTMDEKIMHLDGTIIDVEVVATPVVFQGELSIHVVLRELSYRKKLETIMKLKEEDKLLARHAELVPGLIFQYQVFPDGRFMFPFASKKIWDIFEVTPEDVKNDATLAFERLHEDDSENLVNSIKESMNTLKDWSHEFKVRLPNRGVRWVSGHANPEKLADGSVIWHGYISDITETKLVAQQINQSLQEKEVLLKEVHHRVKNNLQVISSILNLQSSYVRDEATLNVLRESQNRIKSMAFIHESLYQADNFSSINFSDYVVNLLQNLMQSYAKLNQTVKLNVDLQTIFLNLDSAIPCGLVINEIISNALKYAFVENKKGNEVSISMKLNEGRITLVIGDNGVGLPDHIDYRNTESLGLQLVVTLVGQLNGTLELDNTIGTKYTIVFAK